MKIAFKNLYDFFNTICLLFVITSRINSQMINSDLCFIVAISLSLIGIILRINIFFNTLWKRYFELIVAFLALYAVSYFWSIDRYITSVNLLATIGRYICYTYIISNIDSVDGLKKVINLLFAIVIANNVFILVVYGSSSIIRSSASSTSINDIGNNNTIGMLSACAIIFKFYIDRIFSNKKKKDSFMTIIAYVFLFLMILMSGSKKAVLMPIIVFAFMYFLSHKNKLGKFFVIAIIIGLFYSILINVPWFYSVVGERIEGLINGFVDLINIRGLNASSNLLNTRLSSSDRMRAYLIIDGIMWFKERPFWGYGMATFKTLYENYAGTQAYSHNNYIEVAVGLGIVGIVVYYLRYFLIIKQSLQKKNTGYAAKFSLSLVIMCIILDMGLVSYLELEIQIALAIAYFCVTFYNPNSSRGDMNNRMDLI